MVILVVDSECIKNGINIHDLHLKLRPPMVILVVNSECIKNGINIDDLHLKLRPPMVILVVNSVQGLNDLLQTWDELRFTVELHQRTTNLPVDDGRIVHQVMTSNK